MLPLKFRALIGVGGVGSGQFFALNGNHTLGREESRSGRFLERRDYCKLHIISHYVKILLGPAFSAIPISRVGVDEAGCRLLHEMKQAGLDLTYLAEDPDWPTMYSFCFVYPDGSGGNLTTDQSAVDAMKPSELTAAEAAFARFSDQGIALAAPECPPVVRAALIRLATRHNLFRVVALTTAETECDWALDLLRQADLVALNLEEAARLAQVHGAELGPEQVVAAAIMALGALNPHLLISITAGARGSWSWDGARLKFLPALKVPVVSTAGAGDAHLSGLLSGLAWGLNLGQAQEIANLVAGQSVTSPHTIHPGIQPAGLLAFASQVQAPFSEPVMQVLTELAEAGIVRSETDGKY